MNSFRTTRYLLASIMTLAISSGRISAQAAPAAPVTTEDEPIVLSPFVVDASEDAGSYQATATLAGTRIRTDLKDVASSISVVTAQFLKDTGAKNSQDLLVYTTNTEVGGVQGNFAGVGGTFINGATEGSNFLKPQSNTRVRGLDSADNTRDFFLTDIPWDSYNVGRVDLQRGPNSILFGIGSPAGIINASLNTATFHTGGNVENRVGSFGTVRTSLDYNYVLLKRELAVRFSALDDDTKYRQNPAFHKDRRLYGALRWDPKLFGENSSAHTTFRINYEHGDVKSDNPRVLPPDDRITPFFDADKINKAKFDPYYVWAAGIVPYSSSQILPGEKVNYWLVQSPGYNATDNPVFYYDNASTATTVREGGVSTNFGIATNGTRDAGIGGFPYASPVGIASYSAYANDLYRNSVVGSSRYDPTITAAQKASVAGASSGFYKDKALTDSSIFDFYNNMIDGPNKREWQKWEAYNISFEQTFFNNRLALQAVYDRQKYSDGQTRNLGGNTYISVDVLQHTTEYPWAYSSVVNNPNAGRAYTGSNSKNGGNSSTDSDRETVRLTATGEVRADDFLQKSLLSDILGHHVFTGLYSEEKYSNETRNWVRYAVTSDWSKAVGNGADGAGNGGLSHGDVTIDNVSYLTGDLSGFSSAAGLHIKPISAVQAPSGTASIRYYDSHWKYSMDPANPNYVNPAAAWTNPATVGSNSSVSTQSENPANYVGWVNGTYSILNADKGDIGSLYTDGSKVQKKTTSEGLTWQAYLWEDVLVGTVGWRRDKQKQRSGSAKVDTTGLASMAYGLDPLDPLTGVSTGESTSWGLVLHTPKKFREHLPLGTHISFSYSNGKNTRVENRYDFSGNVLPNAVGKTADYSVIVNTLNDRLTLKATFYKTNVKDANLSSTTTEVSTLGSNTYYLKNLEAWGTASALMNIAGMNGQMPGWEWFWSWAEVDHGFSGAYTNPTSAAFLNDPSTVKEKAADASWLSQMMPQSWYDAYGFPVNVAKAQAGDYAHAISNGAWNPFSGVGGVQPSGGGRINGSWPTGTVDNESKGVEFEVTGQPTKNWNLSLNASKTKASQTALGASLVNFIEGQYAKYQSPAGDLRLWWGGGDTFRKTYNTNIWSAYQFQLQTNGKMVPEMSPWRFNLVTNYNFDRGLLKGLNIGLGYRWQDGVILGYALNAAQDNLDVEKPYWGKSQDAVDLWAGYERKVSQKITWRIQLNLRNVGDSAHLQPISVQPDGSPAGFRIEEGMTWQLTNTFSF